MEEYSTLSLIDPTDKLLALSGVIAQLQVITRDACFAGLWKKHFARNLLWQVQSQTPHEKTHMWRTIFVGWRRKDTRKVQRQWIAPSWSFASVNDPVYHNFWEKVPGRYAEQFCLELPACHLIPLDADNPLRKLEAGFARVESNSTCIISHPSSRYPFHYHILLRNKQKLDAQVSFDK